MTSFFKMLSCQPLNEKSLFCWKGYLILFLDFCDRKWVIFLHAVDCVYCILPFGPAANINTIFFERFKED